MPCGLSGISKEARITMMIRSHEPVLRESGLDRKCRTLGTEEGGLPLRPVSWFALYLLSSRCLTPFILNTNSDACYTPPREEEMTLQRSAGVKWWNIIKCLLNHTGTLSWWGNIYPSFAQNNAKLLLDAGRVGFLIIFLQVSLYCQTCLHYYMSNKVWGLGFEVGRYLGQPQKCNTDTDSVYLWL